MKVKTKFRSQVNKPVVRKIIVKLEDAMREEGRAE